MCRAFGSPEPEWPVATLAGELLSDDQDYSVAVLPNFAAKLLLNFDICKFFATFFSILSDF